MKKILITGIAGFVAKHFVEYLQKNNLEYEVLGLDILDDYEINYQYAKYKKIDLTDRALIQEVLDNFKPDYILHLASVSSVSVSWQKPVQSFVNNTNIFLNIVESIRELGLKTKILSVGSSEEYGNYPADKMPLKENYELFPCNPYAVARVSQEMLSKLYANSYNVDIVMTRSFNHIGPRQKEVFVIPSFIRQLINIKNDPTNNEIKVGNIEITRDFLDVRDVVDAYYKILTQGKKGEIYNVCSGNGIKLKEIIETVSKILNISPKITVDENRIRPADNLIIIGDNSKLKSELNWNPTYSLENTLKDMINYMGEN